VTRVRAAGGYFCCTLLRATRGTGGHGLRDRRASIELCRCRQAAVRVSRQRTGGCRWRTGLCDGSGAEKPLNAADSVSPALFHLLSFSGVLAFAGATAFEAGTGGNAGERRTLANEPYTATPFRCHGAGWLHMRVWRQHAHILFALGGRSRVTARRKRRTKLDADARCCGGATRGDGVLWQIALLTLHSRCRQRAVTAGLSGDGIFVRHADACSSNSYRGFSFYSRAAV